MELRPTPSGSPRASLLRSLQKWYRHAMHRRALAVPVFVLLFGPARVGLLRLSPAVEDSSLLGLRFAPVSECLQLGSELLHVIERRFIASARAAEDFQETPSLRCNVVSIVASVPTDQMTISPSSPGQSLSLTHDAGRTLLP